MISFVIALGDNTLPTGECIEVNELGVECYDSTPSMEALADLISAVMETSPPLLPKSGTGGGLLWGWRDPKVPNTGLAVYQDRKVLYFYKGVTQDSGEGNKAAVLRAARAWKSWKDKPPGLWCKPERERLVDFYRLFPEVECR